MVVSSVLSKRHRIRELGKVGTAGGEKRKYLKS